MADVKRRLIAGTINYWTAEEGWANVHMDKSNRPLWNPETEQTHPVDVVWDITELTGSPMDDYDEIRCWQTLEHVDAKKAERVFAGFFRILKPGGVLDIETPNLDAICEAWGGDEHEKADLLNGIYGTPNHDMFTDSIYMLHVTGYWPERMEQMLKDAGFDPLERADAGSLQLRYRAIKPDPNAPTPQPVTEEPKPAPDPEKVREELTKPKRKTPAKRRSTTRRTSKKGGKK